MDAATLTQQIEEKLQEIKTTLERAKEGGHSINEALTEYYVVDPLLNVLGYAPWEVIKRGHDGVANNFPDYTLLPNTPHKWFLEAKKLDLHLQDGEAAQAVNYANNQGAEWAVLTNGRSWYIYNAHLPKPLTEKRVMQINDLFSDADAVGKLLLLSRQSMQNTGLTVAWTQERVTAVVKSQLVTPNSALRKHLRKMGSEETGTALDDAAIGKAIASCGFGNQVSSTGTAVFTMPQTAKAGANGLIIPAPQPITSASASASHTFSEIAKDTTLATYRKPRRLEFLDGYQQDVSSWADAAKVIVERVGQSYTLPALPFKPSHKGNNYFLNSAAVHGKGNPMLGHREALVGTKMVYVDTNRGVSHMAASIAAFLAAADAPPDVVRVSIEIHEN